MSQVFDMTMLGGGVHLWRLVRVLRVLKRFDAWFAVRRLGPHPWFIRLGLWVATFGVVRKRRLPDRQGERLAAALAHLGPAFVKLGQMLATRADLVGPDLAADLRRLQDRMDPFSADQARAAVEETLGRPIAQMFTRFDDRPIAAASIAQVHKAITVDGQTVACKVLRPDVEQRFYRDLRAFAWVARLAELVATEARRLRAQAVVRTLAQSVARELDLRLEAAAASELADNMAGEPGYRLPQVLWTLTGRRVLTMEWIDGVPLADTESVKAAGHDLRHLAERVVQTFLKQAMRDGFFHADLHQGNFFVEADGTLVALDFGIMGRLDRASAIYLAEILWAFQQRDYRRAARAHFRAGYVPPDKSEAEFAQALRAIAEPVHDRPVSEISAGDLLGQLFATTAAFDMHTRPELILLQRSMVMVEGLAAALEPSVNMWAASRPVIEAWTRERLSLEVQAADALLDAARFAGRMPGLIAAAEQAIYRLAQAPAGEAPQPAPAPAPSVFWPVTAAVFAGLSLGLLIALIS
ncbi:MAG: 2-polyprenylphenol 6-hydroxylase [Rhodothalassiaceae bacterium]